MRSISIVAIQLLGVFERESFVCRAGSLAPHLFVLVFCLGVPCTPSKGKKHQQTSGPDSFTPSLQQIPLRDLMADLKRT